MLCHWHCCGRGFELGCARSLLLHQHTLMSVQFSSVQFMWDLINDVIFSYFFLLDFVSVGVVLSGFLMGTIVYLYVSLGD